MSKPINRVASKIEEPAIWPACSKVDEMEGFFLNYLRMDYGGLLCPPVKYNKNDASKYGSKSGCKFTTKFVSKYESETWREFMTKLVCPKLVDHKN